MSNRTRSPRRSPRTVISRQLPSGDGSDYLDVAAACEVVIAHIEGRPLAPLIDPRRAADLIGGLATLVATLAGAMGSGPDQPEAFRALLADIQATSRLIEVFGEPAGQPPPT